MAVIPPRPLAESDDRNLFDCGRESLNIWFRRHAWANQTSGASRVTVITDAASGRIIGYVILSAAQIERAFLPRPQQRNRPDPVPVTLLGQPKTIRDNGICAEDVFERRRTYRQRGHRHASA